MPSAPRWVFLLTLSTAALPAQPVSYSFHEAQGFLKTYCRNCHQGKSPVGGFDAEGVASPSSLPAEAQRWLKISARVTNGSMPPKGAKEPPTTATTLAPLAEHATDHQLVAGAVAAAQVTPESLET